MTQSWEPPKAEFTYTITRQHRWGPWAWSATFQYGICLLPYAGRFACTRARIEKKVLRQVALWDRAKDVTGGWD